jgi:hypothetical protein
MHRKDELLFEGPGASAIHRLPSGKYAIHGGGGALTCALMDEVLRLRASESDILETLQEVARYLPERDASVSQVISDISDLVGSVAHCEHGVLWNQDCRQCAEAYDDRPQPRGPGQSSPTHQWV